ncbi:LacI family DNA-binding transcriptional regulator [Granulicella sibirica]|uniref:Ribose operon repressor n=1 Tax=Granulicella sibirica TaxID=2479048 RepID=A0A4Q0SZ33_9BACT|nr:LacI family DNA-binding transcriptional regulator [Granulicella sibirica]RXH54326.1 Ribose operon repressor [Granulicella sibirica]
MAKTPPSHASLKTGSPETGETTTPSGGALRPNLKMLAAHLGLSPSTISLVLNNVPGRSIPEATRERVRAAAREFNYQPSLIARKLQGKRVNTIGIMLPELGEGYHSQVISGAGELLIREGYFYFTVHHRHRSELVRAYPELLEARGVEGILAIDTHLEESPMLPTVLVAGRSELPGVSNVILDSALGARLALGHLYDLGHRDIVYMRGQPFSADTEVRWAATLAVAETLGLSVDEERVIRLEQDSHSPEIGYPGIKKILEAGTRFTAVVCFNDVSAMGVIRALSDAGLRIPEDVSVIGYDDVQSAAYHVPSLTTIRQPLQKMGEIAAQTLLAKLAGMPTEDLMQVEPELIARESTGPVSEVVGGGGRKARRRALR